MRTKSYNKEKKTTIQKIYSDIIPKDSYIEISYNVDITGLDPEDDDYLDALRILGEDFDGLDENNCKMTIDGRRSKFTKNFNKETRNGYHYVRIDLKEGAFLNTAKGMFSTCTSLVTANLSNLDSFCSKKAFCPLIPIAKE